MKDDIPDSFIKLIIIALGALAWLWVGYALYSAFSPKTPVEPKEGDKTNEIILIQGNCIRASSPPVMIQPRVLGMLTGGLEINEAELLERLWFCEAGYRHEGVWGDSGRAYGAFQFWPGTWNHYCEGSRYDFDDQIKCASYMIFDLGIGQKHWVKCWRRMNLDKYF